MTVYLYWAVKKGYPLWCEELVMESEKRLDLNEFKKLMEKKGYHYIRVTTDERVERSKR